MELLCKCGRTKYVSFGRILPADCEGCDHCNSNFAEPGKHVDRAPHDMQVFAVDGVPKWNTCMKCTKAVRITPKQETVCT